MSIPTNPVSAGSATKKSDYDALYNGSVLVNTGGTPGGAQSIPGVKTFSATTTFESGLIASATSSVFALSNKINLRAGFVASGTCTYYAPVSGEESVGTPHPINGNPALIYNAVPTSGTTYTLDLSSYVPEGTKLIVLVTRCYSTVARGWTTSFGYASPITTVLMQHICLDVGHTAPSNLSLAPVDSDRKAYLKVDIVSGSIGVFRVYTGGVYFI